MYLNDLLGIVAHALPVACISWTFTHEEIFKECHLWLKERTNDGYPLPVRKFCFLFTCEYCLSHWVTLAVLLITDFRPIYEGLLGLAFGFFAIPWLAVLMMDIHQSLRVDIRKTRAEAAKEES